MIAVRGLKEFRQNLNKIKRKTAIDRMYFKAIVTEFDKWIMKNFQQEGRLANRGQRWKKLAPATVAWKKKHKKKRILQNSGDMKKKWQHITSTKTAIIKSKQNYSIYHEEGKGVPQRRLLPDEKQTFAQVKKVTSIFFKKATK